MLLSGPVSLMKPTGSPGGPKAGRPKVGRLAVCERSRRKGHRQTSTIVAVPLAAGGIDTSGGLLMGCEVNLEELCKVQAFPVLDRCALRSDRPKQVASSRP